jgi:uncharacterized caspase-like protein
MDVRKRIIYILMFLACAIPACAKNFVVCVGLSDYPGYGNDLTVSADDAVYMANLFRRNGDSEVYCLTNRNATVSRVVSTMRQAYSLAREHDTVILYFSGHGYNGSFRCYDGALPYSKVTDSMKLSAARKRLVFADACMSGGMRTNNRRSSGYDGVSIMFFLSSRTKEPSREVVGLRNSAFTHYLGRGLKGFADKNGDRVVTARELFDFVSKQVIDLTRRRQHPVMWGNFSDNMSIMQW